MAKEFRLPDLGEGIHEAQVVNVMIKEGDTIAEDQMVMEVETDKAAVELPVPFGGMVASLNVNVGDTIIVGQVLLVVDDGPAAPTASTEAQVGSTPAAAEDRGDAAELATADRDSGAVAVPASPPTPPPEAPRHGPGPIPAAPAIRRLARELAIDLRQVHGTGPGGRIVREDVERYQLAGPTGAGTGPPPAAPAAVPSPAAPAAPTTPIAPARPPTTPAAATAAAPGLAEPLPDFAQWGPVRRERISQIRKTIARQMTRAWTTIPHVTHGDEVDVTDLEAFRKEQGRVFAQQGAKLSLTAFIVKAAAGALREFPQFNASFDEPASEIVYKDYVHVGVAVDTPRGLMVPVLRDVDHKGLVAISRELQAVADRARDFKLDVAELRGGTFTITNVGALGGTFSTPLINWPQVAILGLGKLDDKPVVRDGQILARKILPLFVSFDHRVIDGADGARFLKAIATFLENPLNLLLVS
jgi:pyruvate dehydrogenase E2 component (dihydrolipoamide acetyltransferase)